MNTYITFILLIISTVGIVNASEAQKVSAEAHQKELAAITQDLLTHMRIGTGSRPSTPSGSVKRISPITVMMNRQREAHIVLFGTPEPESPTSPEAQEIVDQKSEARRNRIRTVIRRMKANGWQYGKKSTNF